jgi:hypothetical protein
MFRGSGSGGVTGRTDAAAAFALAAFVILGGFLALFFASFSALLKRNEFENRYFLSTFKCRLKTNRKDVGVIICNLTSNS